MIMKLRYIVLIMIGILTLSGCRTKIQPVAIENRTDSIYIDKLVPYPMPADSASIRALMECDENGKVVLRWLDMANTKNVELMFALDSLGNVIANMRFLGIRYISRRKRYMSIVRSRSRSLWRRSCPVGRK